MRKTKDPLQPEGEREGERGRQEERERDRVYSHDVLHETASLLCQRPDSVRNRDGSLALRRRLPQ